jgi:hypothetical protein
LIEVLLNFLLLTADRVSRFQRKPAQQQHRRSALPHGPAHDEIRIPRPASVQRNSRRRCRTQLLRARRTLPPPDQQHDAQDTGGDADSDNRARTKHPAFVNRHGAAWNARHSLFGYRRRLPLSFAYKRLGWALGSCGG